MGQVCAVVAGGSQLGSRYGHAMDKLANPTDIFADCLQLL